MYIYAITENQLWKLFFIFMFPRTIFKNYYKKLFLKILPNRTKSAFIIDFRKRFQTFYHLNDKNFQVLKRFETIPEITTRRALSQSTLMGFLFRGIL